MGHGRSMAGQGFISRSLRRITWLGRYLTESSSNTAPLRSSQLQREAAKGRPQTLQPVRVGRVGRVESAKAPSSGWASQTWASLDSFLPWWFKSTAELKEQDAGMEGEAEEQDASTEEETKERDGVSANCPDPCSGNAGELDADAIHRLRRELVRQLRAWPVDVNLDDKLGAEGTPSKQVVEKVWVGAMRILINPKDGEMPGDLSLPPSQLGKGIAEGSFKRRPASASGLAGEERYSVEDAHRAINFLKWLQLRHPGPYVEHLLRRLVFCLAKAELGSEIALLADFYRAQIVAQSANASMLITIYYWGGALRETVQFYKDAQDSGLPVDDVGNACVLLAMEKLQFPAQDLLAVYKNILHKTKVRAHIFEALLAAGVRVEQMVEDVDGSARHKVKSRLMLALAKLGRLGEAQIVAREFLQPDVSHLESTTFVMTLFNMVGTGLVHEAQQLADRSKELGFDLPPTISEEIRRIPNASLAVQAYLLLMHLEGSHRRSFVLHYEAVRRCVQLRDVVGLCQAYQAAVRAKDKPCTGAFPVSTYRRVLEILAEAGKVVQVEEVLADCYLSQVHWSASQIEDLKSAYRKMGGMYLAQRMPKKLVNLVQLIVSKKHWVDEERMDSWADALRKRGLVREAVQLNVEALKMVSYRQEKLSQSKGPPPRG